MEEDGHAAERSWANLPGEMLNNISGRLSSMKDFTSFRSVCKPWRTKVTVTNIPHFVEVTDNFEVCSVRSLTDQVRFTLRSYNYGMRSLGSYNGWLILTTHDPLMRCWLHNPFSQSTIELPPWFFRRERICFSSPLTSRSCVALLVGRVLPHLRFRKPATQLTWLEWTENQHPFFFLNYNYPFDVVAVEGRFYVLNTNGCLAVIEWIFLDQPVILVESPLEVRPWWPSSWPHAKIYYTFMVESGGKIFAVFLLPSVITNHIDEVQVFLFDFPTGSWERVYDLDGRVFFVGLNCSFSIARTDEWIAKGDVYFPEKGYFLFKSYNLKDNTMNGHDHRTDLRPQTRGGWLLPSFERREERRGEEHVNTARVLRDIIDSLHLQY